jgi:hypothetical protein
MIWKKLRVVIFASFIALLTLPIQSMAAEGPTISFGRISGQVGEVVEVPVKMSNPNGIVAYGVELNFDQNALEIVGVKDTYGSTNEATCADGESGCVWYSYQNADGMIRVAWADPSAGDHPINKDVMLFTVQFKIKNASLLTDKSLFIQVGDKEALSFTDVTNNPLPVIVEQGTLSNNAWLKGLIVSEGQLNFSKNILKYSISVKNTVDAISFVPTVEDKLSMITINGDKVLSGSVSADLSLKVGVNPFLIEVTAEDGTKIIYEVTVTRDSTVTAPGNDGDNQNPDEPTPGDGTNPSDDTPAPEDNSNPTNPGDDAVPGKDGDDTTEPGTGDDDNNEGELPRTGDDSYIDTYLNIGISVLAAVLLSMWIVLKRRKEQEI